MDKNQKKILIVDDQEENLFFLDSYFKDKVGFITEKAINAVEALKKLDTFIPDIILLDNIMPHMSGHELVKLLKDNEKHRKIPIIMFSANSNIEEQVACLSLGIEDYIVKPINLSNLRERVMAVVNRGV